MGTIAVRLSFSFIKPLDRSWARHTDKLHCSSNGERELYLLTGEEFSSLPTWRKFERGQINILVLWRKSEVYWESPAQRARRQWPYRNNQTKNKPKWRMTGEWWWTTASLATSSNSGSRPEGVWKNKSRHMLKLKLREIRMQFFVHQIRHGIPFRASQRERQNIYTYFVRNFVAGLYPGTEGDDLARFLFRP